MRSTRQKKPSLEAFSPVFSFWPTRNFWAWAFRSITGGEIQKPSPIDIYHFHNIGKRSDRFSPELGHLVQNTDAHPDCQQTVLRIESLPRWCYSRYVHQAPDDYPTSCKDQRQTGTIRRHYCDPPANLWGWTLDRMGPLCEPTDLCIQSTSTKVLWYKVAQFRIVSWSVTRPYVK